jgi:dCMP deaminase
MNAICNAAAQGTVTRGAWLVVNGEPCLMCAKLIHHAGITSVIVLKDGYSSTLGTDYLLRHSVDLQVISPLTLADAP